MSAFEYCIGATGWIVAVIALLQTRWWQISYESERNYRRRWQRSALAWRHLAKSWRRSTHEVQQMHGKLLEEHFRSTVVAHTKARA